MLKKLYKYLREERGAIGLEYTFLSAAIGLMVFGAATLYSDEFNTMFTIFGNYIDVAMTID